jgi:hypothetical protein
MNKKTIFGIFALFVVGIMISTTMVSAYKGDVTKEGPNFSEERHEAMEDAFETMDYEMWKELMLENEIRPKVTDLVTESNFAKFVEAHDAAENGDYETAAKIRAELGLNDGHGPRDGTGLGREAHRGKGMHKGAGGCQR